MAKKNEDKKTESKKTQPKKAPVNKATKKGKKTQDKKPDRAARITKRVRGKIATRFGRGMSNQQIADELSLKYTQVAGQTKSMKGDDELMASRDAAKEWDQFTKQSDHEEKKSTKKQARSARSLWVKGKTNEQIAAKMSLSAGTIQKLTREFRKDEDLMGQRRKSMLAARKKPAKKPKAKAEPKKVTKKTTRRKPAASTRKVVRGGSDEGLAAMVAGLSNVKSIVIIRFDE